MSANEPGQVIEEFCRLFNGGDLEGLVDTLYEDDAVFIPSPTDPPRSGKAQVAEDLKGLLATQGTIKVLQTTTVRNGDLALTHTRWQLDIPSGDPMQATSAEVVRRQPDGTWKYAIDNPWSGAVVAGG